jgi:hypothetical protein
MKCSELQKNRPVVFNVADDITQKKETMDGTVIYVLPERRTVCVGFLDGYKYRTEDIPYEDMLAAYDPNGPEMKFDNIRGPSALLIAE